MASSKQMLVLAVVATVACLAPLASATVFMVGDALGWRANFNQTGWADGKTFVVGDRLMFIYNENHTLALVGKDDFAACNLQGNFLGGPWNSGNVVLTLIKPGKLWFICTNPNHCDGGMKLGIEVVGGTTAPAPSPWFGFPFPGVPAVPGAPAAPAPAPVLLVAAPPSAAVRNPLGGAVAAAAAAMVTAALVF